MVIMRMKIHKLSDMYIQQLGQLWDLVGPLLQLTYSMKTRYVARVTIVDKLRKKCPLLANHSC